MISKLNNLQFRQNREQGFGTKATRAGPWLSQSFSTLQTICRRVDETSSAVMCRADSRRRLYELGADRGNMLLFYSVYFVENILVLYCISFLYFTLHFLLCCTVLGLVFYYLAIHQECFIKSVQLKSVQFQFCCWLHCLNTDWADNIHH